MIAQSLALLTEDVELFEEPLDPSQVIAGTPTVGSRVLDESSDGTVVRGIWRITPGVVTDTEADEIFVVISGSATVEVEGGATLQLRPGSIGLLAQGDRTVWTVHETLTKVFQFNHQAK